ncbi:MAG: glucoamylase family protein [Ancalomicrobiaceae bacterium]|nr:glucoamylase family protein [Ancalomicrobiaceae bacterium]
MWNWATLRRYVTGRTPTPVLWDSRDPIREELFSAERIEEHARSLAATQAVTSRPIKGYPLAKRLSANGAVLLDAYRTFVKSIGEDRAITPAAEWLVDNYYVVERQIREIRSDLPAGYYRQLPKLAGGPFRGYPRVFGIAWAFVAHSDSRFLPEMLLRFAKAYQQVEPLTIGELWALPITLRIVLIENLRRLAQDMVNARQQRQNADALADRLLGSGMRGPAAMTSALSSYDTVQLSDAFAVQIIYRLQDMDAAVAPALSWLDRRLAARGSDAEAVVREVHRRQGAANVSVRNVITSLRLIADIDWNDAVESISLVDEVLSQQGGFRQMDFPTRNLYRSAVEDLARGCGLPELETAERAVEAAGRSGASELPDADARHKDPGYHLVAGGRPAFEAELGFRLPLTKWPSHLIRRFGIAGYGGAIAIVLLILLALPLWGLAANGLGTGWISLLLLLGAIPAMDAAIALVNRGVSSGLRATPLPALELKNGIPAEYRTLVAVPTLLSSLEAIDEQVEGLEIHHLASPDGDLHFALVSDWLDAATEETASDAELLSAAAAGIARLNDRYGPAPAGPRFLLLHRRRQWSESEGRWIGWERKRGKLHELNRLLRGATDTSFIPTDGLAPVAPLGIRYVVTLDADTRLPRDTVHRLIGKMAHPLNRPRFDAATGRVVSGYAVLQPRVTPTLPTAREGSVFQRVFSSLSGIDPYAAAVADVYQDLFGEGSYAGKGIYDVDAFEAALDGRVPEAALLSHDLFEGIFARAGLASDVEVVEEFPTRYNVACLRLHRWARGDWQLLPWIFGSGTFRQAKAAIPAVGRWKMLDNLRRSLKAPFAVMALVAGWTMPLEPALIWTLLILATIVLPTLIPVIAVVPLRRASVTLSSHFRALLRDLRLATSLSALEVVFLADQAVLMGDAIARTVWRLAVSHKHMLEWVPAGAATNAPRLDVAGFYRRMIGAVVIAGVGLAASLLSEGEAWTIALVFSVVWAFSPLVARWVSLSPRAAGDRVLAAGDARFLRLAARSTWRYFETFVTAAVHMLPPDNFQEDPVPVIAHRTSPTNMGLYLLSIVSARDFGWIATNEAVKRLEATTASMSALSKFRGHFYNWYDLLDLSPLVPRYISSVDSGNLAGHLIALANALADWRGRATLPPAQILAGIADALDLGREAAARLRDGRRTQTVTWAELDADLAALIGEARKPVADADLPAHLAGMAAGAETILDMARALALEQGHDTSTDMVFWAETSCAAIAAHIADLAPGGAARQAIEDRIESLEVSVRAMAMAMDFEFLFDPSRKLLSIGYLVDDGALDPSCYDLLASEARLASFIAIAKGDIPARHWFRLGRVVTPVAHGAALVSWSGSMFEYLMPSLVMRAPKGSLLEQTTGLAVRRQISYAKGLGLPWGISESAYNARDLELTYQYSSFGVPGLGLKRGLGGSQVIAPYATVLAAMVDPKAAADNLIRLVAAGGRGRYGFYEALDYTAERLPKGVDVVVVKAFMAHHQGMSIVAIADTLLEGIMRSRFHAEPMVQATELLLQERMPRDVLVARPFAAEAQSDAALRDLQPVGGRAFASPHQARPEVNLLSNGRFTTMLTVAGSGYSRWGDLAITRWREDATCDATGSYIFLRDVQSGAVWSAGFQPVGHEPDSYHVSFQEYRAEFIRRDGPLTTTMEVIVSAEDDAEVRRISIANSGAHARTIEITSYAELVLASQSQDMAHPAFSKLFVETEYRADLGAIIATRRKRSPSEPTIYAAHLAVVDGDTAPKPEIETDRARFLGRGHGVGDPIAMIDGQALSGTVGTVLDPIFALRRRIQIEPGATVRVSFWTVIADSYDAAVDLIDRRRDASAFGRAATLAWTQAQVQLRHLGITAGEAALFQRLAGELVYAGPGMRPASDIIARGSGPQSALWGQGISGDLPIVLLRVADVDYLDIARQLLKAHDYLRMKQFAVDLVILNDRQASYVQDLQIALETLVRTSQSRSLRPGNEAAGRVFVLRSDLMQGETRALLTAVARVVIVAQRGSLLDQLDRRIDPKSASRHPPFRHQPAVSRADPFRRPALEFFNGLGGFDKDGKEYVTILGPGQSTPAPWINVIANADFGFQVSSEGSGYTWSVNSRQNQLTPWSNDPVTDGPGEAFYLRDEDSGDLWSPTALPIRSANGTYVARHGRGTSRFEFEIHGIASVLTQFVPVDGPIKISRLRLTNHSSHVRSLSVTAYVEWVLGASRSQTAPFIVTERDSETGAIFARNPWSMDFGRRVAFADLAGLETEWTGDRREFIGRNGTLSHPAALAGAGRLSGAIGAGLDPCAALRTRIELAVGASVEIRFFLGEAADEAAARRLIATYRATDSHAIEAVATAQWDETLGTVQVRTPDRAMDIMLNGWLTYQTLSCRVWARSGFYQSSGAYGFRDQLQDGFALVSTRPDLVRSHLIAAAGRQFGEGDVQHWWMPHSGQGVRTRISDDRSWLAYAAAHYVEATGDAAVLDVEIPFLEGQALRDGEHDSLFFPTTSNRTASLYEHCAVALDASLALGGHGLPLMGTGDWNDGMNRVGEQGSGESVWLGWLMISALQALAPIATARGDRSRAVGWIQHAEALKASIEREAWDGGWYRRAYFDDGTPLGSAVSAECRIDAIAQSWSVLSGGGDPTRAAQAMASVERELIKPEIGLALLFAPPFDTSSPDPGYIQGYPPGIRENGGQYTHGALWSVMALAKLGAGDKAHALFSLINPINHARSRADIHRYKVEPYVVAADVYARAPHTGRGGWTWYSGSAGWMQRAGLESILGIRLLAGVLSLDPCIPAGWPGYEVMQRIGTARYHIRVVNPEGVETGILAATLDGAPIDTDPFRLPLIDDGKTHEIIVAMGRTATKARSDFPVTAGGLLSTPNPGNDHV